MTPILLDTIIFVVVLLSIVVAFFRGFVREMLTIVNLAGAAAAAWFLSPLTLPAFNNWLGVTEDGEKAKDIWGVIPPEIMATFLAYAAVFFAVFIILSLAGMAIAGGVAAMGLGPLDKFLGILFGAARGVLIVFLVFWPFRFFMSVEQFPGWATNSLSVPALDSAYVWADKKFFREEDNRGEGEEREKPVDPDSLKGKLKKMADDMMKGKTGDKKHGNDADQDVTSDILTDDERNTR